MRFIGLAVVRAQPPTLRCEVFPAASAVSAPAGHSVGDREARIKIDNGKAGVE
jgi:hypothetical protein